MNWLDYVLITFAIVLVTIVVVGSFEENTRLARARNWILAPLFAILFFLFGRFSKPSSPSHESNDPEPPDDPDFDPAPNSHTRATDIERERTDDDIDTPVAGTGAAGRKERLERLLED